MKTIAVIGLGSIGMRHAKNLLAMGHKVTGFDPEAAGVGFSTLWPIDWDLMDKFDAVVIASPTPRHYFDIADALGGPSFFVEKPIADRLPDFPDTYNQAKMVGYNLRFHPCVKKAKEWLDAGKIGKPLWANFILGQHSIKPPYLRDGVILNWSHEIDLALYLLGDALVMGSNTLLRDGKDTMTDILLSHKGECQSTIHLDYITDPEERHFVIIGSEGGIYINVKLFHGALRILGEIEETISFPESWNETYVEEMKAFLDRCDGKETIGCTGEEGLKVLKVCLKVRQRAGLS